MIFVFLHWNRYQSVCVLFTIACIFVDIIINIYKLTNQFHYTHAESKEHLHTRIKIKSNILKRKENDTRAVQFNLNCFVGK